MIKKEDYQCWERFVLAVRQGKSAAVQSEERREAILAIAEEIDDIYNSAGFDSAYCAAKINSELSRLKIQENELKAANHKSTKTASVVIMFGGGVACLGHGEKILEEFRKEKLDAISIEKLWNIIGEHEVG